MANCIQCVVVNIYAGYVHTCIIAYDTFIYIYIYTVYLYELSNIFSVLFIYVYKHMFKFSIPHLEN